MEIPSITNIARGLQVEVYALRAAIRERLDEKTAEEIIRLAREKRTRALQPSSEEA